MTRALSLAAIAAAVAACGGCERGGAAGSTSAEPGRTAYWQPGASSVVTASVKPPPEPTLAGGHPRLFVRASDLPRLRSWAVPSNPSWRALQQLATTSRADMDSGKVPDADECAYQNRYCESYAELFAFLSLVDPSPAAREDAARRARKLLMTLVGRASAAAPSDPKWGTRYATYNRSRWVGEAYGLVVDWIYPSLTAEDKKAIRSLFLRWSEDLLHATVTGYNHPEPIGVINDPVLVRDKHAVRFGANNYFVGHMRNLGLMAMSLDAADDPAEPGQKRTYPRLRDYLGNAIGAWMYVQDHLFRGEARGGAPPEGFEYGPETLSYITELHLAIRTAGEEDPAKYGPQVAYDALPFWNEAPAAYVHALSPASIVHEAWEGPAYQAAWIGDGENETPLDPVDFFGPLGVYGMVANQPERVNAARFIELELATGGKAGFERRATAYHGGLPYLQALWYFLLFDPTAPAPTDFRAKLPLVHVDEGIGQIQARTSWKPDAAWFTYLCGWETIDHRHGDGNSFGFWRGGEWLTKERVGYGWFFENSDQHDTLAIENALPRHSDDQRIGSYQRRGSQYVFFSDDGKVLAHSFGKDFVYALGDATGLYNSTHEGVVDVTHASRSILWLEPDFIVLYDRATTKTPARFKRFYLQTPTEAKVSGGLATVTTKSGQQLFVRTLLPEKARIATLTYQASGTEDRPAQNEPMTAVLRVEPRTVEKDARFLHVLEGASAGDKAEPSTLVQSASGTPFVGAAFKDAAVLFPVNVEAVTEVDVTLPAGATRVFVTGLEPGAGYDVARQGPHLHIKKGGPERADSGGVLAL
ncbi:MAG TPA: hypothetical protein VHB21_04055 [Minicystis sp.]|nr:hypothetical protein [Minicystis sp.]